MHYCINFLLLSPQKCNDEFKDELFRINGKKSNGIWQDNNGIPIDTSAISIEFDLDDATLTIDLKKSRYSKK